MVTDLEMDPTNPRYENTCMDTLFISKKLLVELMDRAFAHGYHGLMRDVLQRMIRDAGLKVKGYEYHDLCYRMDSIQSYFQFNLDMLNTELRHNFFREDRPIYTKVRDEMPARYMDEAVAVNSMVADGCIINGRVEHSVIFRGVKIAKGATVKNCVIMQDARIDEGVYLENCILDKQAHIQKDGRLIGPKSYPIVLSKNMVI